VSGAPDEELIRRHLAGDRAAFPALVERHERRVWSVALRMLGRPEDAADTTQEVFLTCLRKLHGFRGTSAFTTWLHRVTLNACYDALRRRAREAPAADEDGPPEPPPVADHADAAAARLDMRRALARVPDDFRAVLVLHDMEGLPYQEVAEAVGVPVGTVKSRLHRGRVALARVMRGEHREGSEPSKGTERMQG
jgi:RNA polymerase sigma-70 factor (ECF subfamily)